MLENWSLRRGGRKRRCDCSWDTGDPMNQSNGSKKTRVADANSGKNVCVSLAIAFGSGWVLVSYLRLSVLLRSECFLLFSLSFFNWNTSIIYNTNITCNTNVTHNSGITNKAVRLFVTLSLLSIKIWKCKDKQKLRIKTDVSVSSWRHCQGEVKNDRVCGKA